MAKAFAKRRNDLQLLSDIKVFEASKSPDYEPGLTLAGKLLRQGYDQSNFEVRMKMIKNARREIEMDTFFKSCLDEMIGVQEKMKDIVIAS